MYITRQDMIDRVNNAFSEYGYRSYIDKRLGFGLGICPLTTIECEDLNDVVKLIDSIMLINVHFEPSMAFDEFSRCISRLLYVAGKWLELCFYQLLINDISGLFYVNICNECETHINVFFTTKDSNICMGVDDQKVGIKMVRTIKMGKEF